MARQLLGSRRTRTIAVASFLATVTVGGLAACGHEPAQSKEHASTSGLSTDIGSIGIRNAEITLGPNSTAVITMALFNQGSASDTLTAVSSDTASGSQLPNNASLTLPTDGGVFLKASDNPIVLTGMKDTLVGSSISVNLTFAIQGQTTIRIPVVARDDSLNVGPTPSASTTPTSTATPSA